MKSFQDWLIGEEQISRLAKAQSVSMTRDEIAVVKNNSKGIIGVYIRSGG